MKNAEIFKLISLVLALVICLSLCACGGGEKDYDYAIFVSCDIVNFRKDVLLAVRERVKEMNPQINTERIVMNATHTHAGPILEKGESLGLWGNLSDLPHDGIEITPPSEYYDFFIERVSEAICESFESRKEGYISYGYGYAITGYNRRAVYNKDMTEGNPNIGVRLTEGKGKMYGPTNIPEFSHLETGADPYANFFFTYNKDEKLTGAIINIPCPSQNMEMEYYLSADFWGDLFGEKSFTKILGIFITVNTMGFAFGSPVINFVYDQLGSYKIAFLACGVLMIFVTIIMQFVITKAHMLRKEIVETEDLKTQKIKDD